MPEIVCKRKMISLRLSDAEYEVLKMRYRDYGARNVSDLARLALQRIMNGSDGFEESSADKLAKLDDRVRALESRVALMMQGEESLS